MRFIQPNRACRQLKPGATTESSIVSCELGDAPAGLSDDEPDDSDNDLSMDLTLPPEQLSEDLDLLAEMELDQQLWFRSLDLQIAVSEKL